MGFFPIKMKASFHFPSFLLYLYSRLNNNSIHLVNEVPSVAPLASPFGRGIDCILSLHLHQWWWMQTDTRAVVEGVPCRKRVRNFTRGLPISCCCHNNNNGIL
jgi:hypothetical protein